MKSHYRTMAVTLGINAVIMYFVMYAMIENAGHFYLNVNRAYMTLLMVAPMGILMLFMMRSMFGNTKLNAVLYALFAALFVVALLLARLQGGVGDKQFLRSMIPHHSSAILMCRQAALTDAEIQKLCGSIVKSQQEEIAQMKAILERY